MAIIRGSLKFLRDLHIYDKIWDGGPKITFNDDGGPHFYLIPVLLGKRRSRGCVHKESDIFI